MNGRSEHDIVTRAGYPIILGGVVHSVPPLTIDLEEAWADRVRERFLGILGGIDLDVRAIGSVVTLLSASTSVLIELLRNYDETLPDAAWFRANATSQEVQDGFVTLLEHAFPPLGMSRRLIPAEQRSELVGMLVEMARDYLPALARAGRALRAADASSASEPATRSPSKSGGSARRRSSARP